MLSFISDLPVITDLSQVIDQKMRLLDVRAPVEYQAGAVPGADNMPLLDDAQRHQVGLRYQQQGQESAIRLGLQLLDAAAKQQRTACWHAYATRYPDGALYCFRGGLRSRISQQWLYEATGIRYPRIEGGYKALRGYLLQQLECYPRQMSPVVIAGQTGVGKTHLLHTLAPHLDLEGLAHHRGSAFGQYAVPQPTQADFENRLACALIRLTQADQAYFVIEDESRQIGSRHIPAQLYAAFNQAPVVVLQTDIAQRVARICQEYVYDGLAEHQQRLGAELGFQAWADSLNHSLERIQRRLGGVNYRKISQLLQTAITQHDHNPVQHHTWIRALLTDYYDRMYDYQLARKQHRVVYCGDDVSVREYLSTYYSICA
ncbi:MAG: tRNA 2-selenouridine(34) synthase MnmH [Pseudomonadota bacterium]